MRFSGRTLYIVNKKAQLAAEIVAEGTVLLLRGADGGILENGKIDLASGLYACLYCKQLRNITWIVRSEKIFGGALILADEVQMEQVLQLIKEACPVLELSEQNAKINGYVASVVEKLQEGTTVTIMETKEERVKCCPMCGMECDPNIPYCMECGAEV